jgi:hypothetical protein
MKLLAAVLTLLFSAGLMQAQTPPAAPATEPKAPATTKAAPAKKEEKKKEELPVIPGYTITRVNGDLLGLEVVGGNFKLTFYDKKHKAMPMDVTRAAARWPNVRGPGDNRTVLNGSGSVLVGSKPVIPPFVFNVYLTLLKGEGDAAEAVESYVVPFRG